MHHTLKGQKMDIQTITREAIRACRTKYQLAKRLKTDWNTVHQWEQGKREPNGKHLLEMLRIAQERSGHGRAATLAVLLTMLCGAIWQPQDAVAKASYPTAQERGGFIHYTNRRVLRS